MLCAVGLDLGDKLVMETPKYWPTIATKEVELLTQFPKMGMSESWWSLERVGSEEKRIMIAS